MPADPKPVSEAKLKADIQGHLVETHVADGMPIGPALKGLLKLIGQGLVAYLMSNYTIFPKAKADQ